MEFHERMTKFQPTLWATTFRVKVLLFTGAVDEEK